MTITINGTSREVNDGYTVLNVLDDAKLKPSVVAVELNRRLLRTERYGESLKDGDQLEIVTFVGGG